MRVIWVLENIKKTTRFYGKLNTILLLSSVRLWKKNHQKDNCVLYADSLTLEFLTQLNVIDFWDEIVEYSDSLRIDKNIFWSAAKLEVISKQSEPFILLDNDTLVYKELYSKLDLSNHWVMNLEMGKGYYPTNFDHFIRSISYKQRWLPESVNVSFLYMPDFNFAKKYAKLSLNMMEEFTQLNVPNSQYLIFAEQLLLKHLFDLENISYKSLIKNYWLCDQWKWGAVHNDGIWEEQQHMKYIRHYGPYKNQLKEKKLEKEYFFELKSLFFSINFRNFHLTQFLNSNEYPK